MNKKRILLCVFSILLFCVAASPPKFWHGLLRTPTAEWAGAYGTGDTSTIAYNCWTNRQLVDGQGKVIAAMKKELDELKAVVDTLPDPNVVDPNEWWAVQTWLRRVEKEREVKE
ncbi:MAG: hypothetical protein V3W44_04330 [Dehalococcoidales bacterium]